MRVMKHHDRDHDYIRDALGQALERIPGVQATREPRVENPQDGGDERRGDIRVHKGGTTWAVDVGVVCPGTTRYVGEGAATVPGRQQRFTKASIWTSTATTRTSSPASSRREGGWAWPVDGSSTR